MADGARVELKLARKISTSAAESYQSARSEASQKLLQRGFLSLAGGLGFTGLSYAVAGAGESYLITTGAIGFGLLQIITGVLLLVIKSFAPEDSLRVMFCLIACGIGLLILTVLFTDNGFSDLGEESSTGFC